MFIKQKLHFGDNMSAFLGPIHYLMYDRILLAAERESFIYDFVSDKMSPGQKDELKQKHAEYAHQLETGDLAEMIGATPIHSWLQEAMEATIVSEAALIGIIADKPEREAVVFGAAREHGMKVGEKLSWELPAVKESAQDVLQHMDRLMLTSMPCDRIAEVLAVNDKSFIVRRDLLFHEPLWNRAKVNAELMIKYQELWLQGFFSAMGSVKFIRAEVQAGGRRMWDDRFMFNQENKNG
jgi:hypothetical protein